MQSQELISFLILLLILIGLFLLLREIVMWYWKINKIIENQEITINNQKKQIWLTKKSLENSGVIFTEDEINYLK